MRVVSIIGTRPEALKMAPILRVLADTKGVESRVIVTGQHRDLIAAPLALFGIRADQNLRVSSRNEHPDALLAPLLSKLAPTLSRLKPDWVLAAGDTTSAFCASLAALYRRVPFGHVEAGLRTGRLQEPFPEEFHRRVAAVAAQLHFAPNRQARQNLLREGVPASAILVTGNPIIDALKHVDPDAAHSEAPRRSKPALIVVTFHRRENLGRPVEGICQALRRIAQDAGPDVRILCLVHPNPRVSRPARSLLRGIPNVTLSPPIEYPEMIAVLKSATLLLTDSGGLQEEAPYLGVPTLVLRNVTERPEGVAAKVVRLVGTNPETIFTATRRLLRSASTRAAMIDPRFDAYGDGHAAERIVRALCARRKDSR